MSNNYGVFSLEEKVVVVTGGTRRYGAHFCEALGEAGATVILTSRDQSRADDTARGFRDIGLEVFGYSLELGDDSSIEVFVDAVIQDYGRIDVLVNSARTTPGMIASELTREALDQTFTVNLVGMILLTRRVVEEMKQAGGGISSTSVRSTGWAVRIFLFTKSWSPTYRWIIPFSKEASSPTPSNWLPRWLNTTSGPTV